MTFVQTTKIYIMKKIIFTSLIALISLSTFAQGKSGKNKNHNGNGSYQKHKEHNDDRYEDRDRKDKKDKDDERYDDRDRNDRGDRDENRRNNNGKYSKNTPRNVANAFARDFPNATNVTWTKNSGNWTATFSNGGLILTTRTVTYRANGQRVSSNGIFR